MSTQKALLSLALFATLFGGAVAGFNYVLDPFCYYCQDFNLQKVTLNRYYLMAQTILAHPETEQIILGSSRGETTSPLWVQDLSKMKTLNLSVAGAEVITKKALTAIALEKTQLKRVIWLADYFELITADADIKIRNTRAFKKYASDFLAPEDLQARLHELQQLIDHTTLEASLAALHHKSAAKPGQGEGSQIDYSACAQPGFPGKETPQSLVQKVDLFYQEYVEGPIKPAQDPQAWEHFAGLVKNLQKRNVALLIVIPPYHPTFVKRLKEEYPRIYQAHLKWIDQLQSLQGPGVQVINDFAGIPDDDGSPTYWNDGVHFTCKGVIQILQKVLPQAPQKTLQDGR